MPARRQFLDLIWTSGVLPPLQDRSLTLRSADVDVYGAGCLDFSTLILYGTAFPVVQEVKFLGLIFDSELTFLPHLCYLKKKCMKALNLLRILANTSWGADLVTSVQSLNPLQT